MSSFLKVILWELSVKFISVENFSAGVSLATDFDLHDLDEPGALDEYGGSIPNVVSSLQVDSGSDDDGESLDFSERSLTDSDSEDSMSEQLSDDNPIDISIPDNQSPMDSSP